MTSEVGDAFLRVHLDHMQLKLWSQDWAITSGSAIWLQNSNCARTSANSKDAEKCSFQDRWLKNSAYQEWVLKDKVDKHYAQPIFCVLYCCDGPYKI